MKPKVHAPPEPVASEATTDTWAPPPLALSSLTTTTTLEAPYLPCFQGPDALRAFDEAERQWGAVSVTRYGKPTTVEQYAETLIADCQQHLQIFQLQAGYGPEYAGRALAAQSNLQFMQWWLQNRRNKRRGAHP